MHPVLGHEGGRSPLPRTRGPREYSQPSLKVFLIEIHIVFFLRISYNNNHPLIADRGSDVTSGVRVMIRSNNTM